MYKIYCDGTLIYHPNIEELKVLNAKIELEQNGIGTFEFEIYPSNPYINLINKMKSVIEVYQDGFLLFKGVAAEDVIGYRNQRKIKCKQEYHFLNYSVLRPYEFTGTPAEYFTMVINNHNARVEEKHQFKVGAITVTDPNDYITRSNSESVKTWDEIKNKLIDMLGGYLRIRHEDDDTYIDYLADFNLQGQEVNFGENLLDVQKESSGLDIATVLIPYGAQTQEGETTTRINITSVNDGKDYVEDLEAIEKYGRIEVVETWNDVTEPQNLLTKAKKALSDKLYLITGITLTAFDMGRINKDINQFRMHNYIKVKSAYHDLDDNFLPMKMSISLFNPANDKLELNKTRKSLTDIEIEKDNQFNNVVNTVAKVESDYQINIPIIKQDIKSLKEMNNASFDSIEFYLSTSRVELTGGSWSKTPPEWQEGYFFWQRVNIKYADGTIQYGDPVCISGADGTDGKDGVNGEDGKDGTNGKDGVAGTGVENIEIEFYMSTSKDELADGEWSPTPPAWENGLYLWTRQKITYNNPVSVEYTTPTRDTAWDALDNIKEDLQNQIGNANTNIIELTEQLQTEIKQSEDRIISSVSQNYYTRGDAENLISSMSTQLEQTSNGFEMRFESFEKDLSDVNNDTNAQFEEIRKNIRFEDGKILLGVEGNEIELAIANDRISFKQAGHEVAYISKSKITITDAEFMYSLQIGNFAFVPRSNGSLDFIKVV